MFENQTEDLIRERMLSNISDEIDKREGSIAYDMLSPKAIELAMAYSELDNVIQLAFAGTTYGEFLDMKAAEVGVERLPALKSQGTLTLTNLSEDPIEVPIGTIAYTERGINFLTTEYVLLGLEPATVNIVAQDAGVSGNVPANSIVAIELNEVECTNVSATTGGTDIETDESLLEKFYAKVRSPGVSGNKNQYLQWARSIQGIGDAKVVPTWNGPNTVKVILIDSNKQVVNPAKVQEVSDYIEDVRPIGAIVTVESAVNQNINISATLTIQQDYDISTIQPIIESEINKYFKSATFVDLDIKLSRIGTIILATEGVLDYTNLMLNNSAENVQLLENGIPTIGTVTFT